MTTQTIDSIPAADAERIRQQVLRTLEGMDLTERRIQEQGYASLAAFVAQIAYDIAHVLGYAIALPLAWAKNVVTSVGLGVADGFAQGLREQDAYPKRRR